MLQIKRKQLQIKIKKGRTRGQAEIKLTMPILETDRNCMTSIQLTRA